MAGAESSTESLSEDVKGELEALGAIYAGDGEFVVEQGDGCHDNNSSSDYICEVIVKPADMMIGLCFSLSGMLCPIGLCWQWNSETHIFLISKNNFFGKEIL